MPTSGHTCPIPSGMPILWCKAYGSVPDMDRAEVCTMWCGYTEVDLLLEGPVLLILGLCYCNWPQLPPIVNMWHRVCVCVSVCVCIYIYYVTLFYYIISFKKILYYIVLNHVISYYIILNHIISFYAFFILLNYIVFY